MHFFNCSTCFKNQADIIIIFSLEIVVMLFICVVFTCVILSFQQTDAGVVESMRDDTEMFRIPCPNVGLSSEDCQNG